jgi:hypothetical protein
MGGLARWLSPQQSNNLKRVAQHFSFFCRDQHTICAWIVPVGKPCPNGGYPCKTEA